jgi:hypothetical protein
MTENKFSKFAVNYLSSKKDKVYSYTALDEEKKCVLMIRPRGGFDLSIPASIEATCDTNFILPDYEEITAEQFWRIFKIHTIQLYQYYQNQVEQTEPV